MTDERTIPILPSRSVAATVAFYARLGFAGAVVQAGPEGYAILRCGLHELHFFGFPELDPVRSYAGCYLRVPDVEAWHERLARAGLPKAGIPRLTPVQDRPWGMRELALVDPDGNLLRIGTPLDPG